MHFKLIKLLFSIYSHKNVRNIIIGPQLSIEDLVCDWSKHTIFCYVIELNWSIKEMLMLEELLRQFQASAADPAR